MNMGTSYQQTTSFQSAFLSIYNLQPTCQWLWCNCSVTEGGVEIDTILLPNLPKDDPGQQEVESMALRNITDSQSEREN